MKDSLPVQNSILGEAKQQDTQQSPQVVLAVCDELFGQAITDFVIKHSWTGVPVFHLLFVIELGGLPVIESDVASIVENDERKYGSELIGTLSSKITEACPEAKVVSHIANGAAPAEILRLAEAVGADMIVVGSHGRTGLRRIALGSVSFAVVTQAKCSTVVLCLSSATEPTQLPGPVGITASDLPAKMTTYAPIDNTR